MAEKGVDVKMSSPRSPEIGLWDSRSNKKQVKEDAPWASGHRADGDPQLDDEVAAKSSETVVTRARTMAGNMRRKDGVWGRSIVLAPPEVNRANERGITQSTTTDHH
ncbi:hypothetical protein PIB30_061026 [Stylosanthes scabra]|uniref:Uncharacterized protein n=1 Tax=Stylosanthes scabra TaxID=79078 RepID=A0ABU6WJ17_9FABA|nr:hypothetical protein [Stylosanthes scabra]